MNLREIVKREAEKAFTGAAVFHRPAARRMGLAVAKAVVAHYQPLVDAADDLAYCQADPDPANACGTCFGCHLIAGLQNIKELSK